MLYEEVELTMLYVACCWMEIVDCCIGRAEHVGTREGK
jgi:hypothetical protein